MNKYQEAYDILFDNLLTMPQDISENEKKLIFKSMNLIEEACDKAEKYDEKETPKKPLRFKDKFYIPHFKCPICKTTPHIGNQKYCDECGQKLDWSEENE